MNAARRLQMPFWPQAAAASAQVDNDSMQGQSHAGGQTRALCAAVLAAHAALLFWAHGHLDRPPAREMPVITGALISAEAPAETPPQPLPMADRPRPVEPRPVEPVRRPMPIPVRRAAPKPASVVPSEPPKPILQSEAPPEPASAPTRTAAPNPPPDPAKTAAATASPAVAAPAAAATTSSAAAPSQPAAAPVAVTPPRSDATHLDNPPPVYPPVSRRLGEQGQVLLEVRIEPDGTVSEIRLKRSSGFERLDNAAMKTVRNWRYVPARRGDQPIAWWYLQPIVFTLNN